MTETKEINMEKNVNIRERLALIQKSLNAPKTRYNKFGNYSYRSCEDILEAVKPLLEDCLLTVSDEIVEIGGRIYVKATAEIRDLSGDSVGTTAYAREEETKKGMDVAQVTGSASSYARKYALNGLFAIDDNKDPDTDEYAVQSRRGGKAPSVDKAIKEVEAAGSMEELAGLWAKWSPQFDPSSDAYGRLSRAVATSPVNSNTAGNGAQ